MKMDTQAISTVDKTLLTIRLFNGFWDRWIAHGVSLIHINQTKGNVLTVNDWLDRWFEYVIQLKNIGYVKQENHDYEEAEKLFRKAALYLSLIQWIIPDRNHPDKQKCLMESVRTSMLADGNTSIQSIYKSLLIENKKCKGRIRIPVNPKGCVVMLNPMDSTKEELYTYEMDFASGGYVVFNFDGPGQGETYTFENLKATNKRWKLFVDELINLASQQYPNLPIYLFGTSSGAAWSLYGSTNSKVTKVVAVSPAIQSDPTILPEYFLERLEYVTEEQTLPVLETLQFLAPVLLVHGKQDVMVSDASIQALFEQLPNGKKYLEYENESHCCNYKLDEIRQRAMEWFQER